MDGADRNEVQQARPRACLSRRQALPNDSLTEPEKRFRPTPTGGRLDKQVARGKRTAVEEFQNGLALVRLSAGPSRKDDDRTLDDLGIQLFEWLCFWQGTIVVGRDLTGVGGDPVSAWSVGRRGGTESLSLSEGPNDIKAFVDRLVQWIPADVIAIYTVGITALSSQQDNPNPSPVWLIACGVVAFILVILAAVRTRRKVAPRDLLLALMAVVAFAIWALAIPDSGWYQWHAVADNPGWVAAIAGLGGIVFGAIADTFFSS